MMTQLIQTIPFQLGRDALLLHENLLAYDAQQRLAIVPGNKMYRERNAHITSCEFLRMLAAAMLADATASY